MHNSQNAFHCQANQLTLNYQKCPTINDNFHRLIVKPSAYFYILDVIGYQICVLFPHTHCTVGTKSCQSKHKREDAARAVVSLTYSMSTSKLQPWLRTSTPRRRPRVAVGSLGGHRNRWSVDITLTATTAKAGQQTDEIYSFGLLYVSAASGHSFAVYSVSKNPPRVFWFFLPPQLRIFSSDFTYVLLIPIYAGLQILIQLSAILTKLCHIKCDRPVHTTCSKCPPSAETPLSLYSTLFTI